MENNKVYLVVEQWATDGVDGNDIKVFNNNLKAEKYFESRLKEIVTMDYEVIEKKNKSVVAYDEGYYAYSHTCLDILEKDIIKEVE